MRNSISIMKDTLLKFLNEIGIVWQYLLSGVLGAAVWSIHKKKKFWDSVRNIISGGIVSSYATPFIANKVDVNLSFLGFLVGIVGMNVLDELYLVIVKNRGKLRDIFKTIFQILYK